MRISAPYEWHLKRITGGYFRKKNGDCPYFVEVKEMKRVLLVAFLFGFLTFLYFPCSAVSYSNQPEEEVILLQIGSINLWRNGQVSIQMDVAPFIEKNRTWVPVRFVSEALGAEVKWIQEKQQVCITMGGDNIILTIGSNYLVVNGKSQTMDVEPFLRSNRTWVPLRFVAENLGCSVSWVQSSQEVVIRRGPFSGPTVAFVQNGQLIMSEVSENSLGVKRVLAKGNATGEEISGPLAWSFNGIKIAYYRIQKLNFDFFRLSLEYQIESSGVSIQLLSRNNAYGGLKALSWSSREAYLLYDEPTSDVSGTLWLVMVEKKDSAPIGVEGEVIYGTFSPDGIHQAWLTYGDKGISVLVLDGNGIQLKIGNITGGFVWSPDGGSLAVSTSQGIEVYDVSSPMMPPEIYALPGGYAYYLFWSPDRNWITGSCSDGTFALYTGWGQIPWPNAFPGDLFLIDHYHPSAPAGFLPSGKLVLEHIGEASSGTSNFYIYDLESQKASLLLENAEYLTIRP